MPNYRRNTLLQDFKERERKVDKKKQFQTKNVYDHGNDMNKLMRHAKSLVWRKKKHNSIAYYTTPEAIICASECVFCVLIFGIIFMNGKFFELFLIRFVFFLQNKQSTPKKPWIMRKICVESTVQYDSMGFVAVINLRELKSFIYEKLFEVSNKHATIQRYGIRWAVRWKCGALIINIELHRMPNKAANESYSAYNLK